MSLVKKSANDAEVLRCSICKLVYHVVNCSKLNKDCIPPPTSMKMYIKFANKQFPSGVFSWCCHRCKSLETITAKRGLEERVSLLEALLLTLVPQSSTEQHPIQTRQQVAELVESIRSDTGSSVDIPAPLEVPSDNSEVLSVVTPSALEPPTFSAVTSAPPPSPPSAPLIPTRTSSSTTNRVWRQISNGNNSPPPSSTKRPASNALSYKVHASPKPGAHPVQNLLQRAYFSGTLNKNIKSRFHFKKNNADFFFPTFAEASTSLSCLRSILKDFTVHEPLLIGSKSIRIAGLCDDYSPDQLFSEITSCGHNPEIQQLMNKDTFQIHSVKAYKLDPTRFWASATVSEAIYKVIVGKMKRHLKTAYLKLPIFDSKRTRCSNCQGLDGHLRKDCTNNPVCAKCSGNHATDSCSVTDETRFKCVNCSKLDNANANHRADSTECPAFQAAITQERTDSKNYFFQNRNLQSDS